MDKRNAQRGACEDAADAPQARDAAARAPKARKKMHAEGELENVLTKKLAIREQCNNSG